MIEALFNVVFPIAALGVVAWGFAANEITFRQRRVLLMGLVARRFDSRPLLSAFNSVSYSRHSRAVFWFRDWRRLYPRYLRDAIPEAFI